MVKFTTSVVRRKICILLKNMENVKKNKKKHDDV